MPCCTRWIRPFQIFFRSISRSNPRDKNSHIPCGSGIARESAGSVNHNACLSDAFASKPAPTGNLQRP
ncbi:hypothetical protein EPZ47_25605 [Pseudomonas viciae]|uniref:Uncharacterized protein n=1 Tax=Pseudomonas viciae TaxID=2505979 RepID=A0A4V1CBC5_9PSED|nr:hypothetical protein EPZ47_25605 [Pseudomonas viciae]